MKTRRCKNIKCRCLFEVKPRNPDQKYCSREECQKARKAERQRRMMANDKEYRKDQEDCKEKWKTENPDYSKKYREKNPEYTKRNREKQKERDRSKRASKTETSVFQHLAKMHPSEQKKPIRSGRYKLIPVKDQNLAKMHPIIVEISEITEGYPLLM